MEHATHRLDEALELLGYALREGSEEGLFQVWTPEGRDAGEITLSECWFFLKERHRELFEVNPPLWDERRYGPFRLEFTRFCGECGFAIFNGRHECADNDGPM